jgi:hypothetical protein
MEPDTTLTHVRELLVELEAELPPVRWHDPVENLGGALSAELVLLSPATCRRVLDAMGACLGDDVAELDEALTRMCVIAIRYGQGTALGCEGMPDGETCAALLDVCDVIREWSEEQ